MKIKIRNETENIYANRHVVVWDPRAALASRPATSVLILGYLHNVSVRELVETVAAVRRVVLLTDAAVAEFVSEDHCGKGWNILTTFFPEQVLVGTWDVVLVQADANRWGAVGQSTIELLEAAKLPIVCRELWIVPCATRKQCEIHAIIPDFDPRETELSGLWTAA